MPPAVVEHHLYPGGSGQDPNFQTAWATSTFHVESVRKARAELDAKGYASNRSHHTLDYLSRDLGKTPMDMGAAYMELKDAELNQAYAEWQRRQRGEQRLWDRLLNLVFGRRRAHSLKSLMMTDEEKAREREREVGREGGGPAIKSGYIKQNTRTHSHTHRQGD
jgi:hypothetical protein